MKCISPRQLRLLGAALLGLLCSGCTKPDTTAATTPINAQRQGGEPEKDPVLGAHIVTGVTFQGRLWLLGANGSLVSFGLSDETRRAHFASGVADIKKMAGELWILQELSERHANSSANRGETSEFSVAKWDGSAFEERSKLRLAAGESPIALVAQSDVPLVLTSTSIRRFSGAKSSWETTTLKGALQGGVQTHIGAPTNGGNIYVGIDRGEWGGGLHRVDVSTGAISSVERRDDKELCSGPLNAECDPVTGIISDPQRPNCVLVSIGLLHMLSHGRILGVCDDQVTVIFEQPWKTSFGNKTIDMTEAMFGLAPASQETFWAISPRAIYRFDKSAPKAVGRPEMKPFAGVLRLSRQVPGVIILMTDARWAASVSGSTPMLIPVE